MSGITFSDAEFSSDQYFLLLCSSFPLTPSLPVPPAGPPGYEFGVASLQHDVILVWLHEL